MISPPAQTAAIDFALCCVAVAALQYPFHMLTCLNPGPCQSVPNSLTSLLVLGVGWGSTAPRSFHASAPTPSHTFIHFYFPQSFSPPNPQSADAKAEPKADDKNATKPATTIKRIMVPKKKTAKVRHCRTRHAL